ncbi:MAG: restriction endonuclease [Paracoccaceae bacterium]|jgi:hypothetical protein
MEQGLVISAIIIFLLILGWRHSEKKKSQLEVKIKQAQSEVDRLLFLSLEHENTRRKLIESEQKLSITSEKLDKFQNQVASEIRKIDDEKLELFPWLSQALGDYAELWAERLASKLENKNRPAPKSAESIRALKHRLAMAEKERASLKYHISFYEESFPWITDVSGTSLAEILKEKKESDQTAILSNENKDYARNFLSDVEYSSLSDAEKYQLALNRWKNTKKTNWQIGRDFERYVGYEYEDDGWDVEYFGAIKGFEDLGRDLICKRKGQTRIVQCKYWSKDKTIHEKHIFQLFGSKVEYVINTNTSNGSLPLFNPMEQHSDIQGVFITSAYLSEKAKQFAKVLQIQFHEGFKLDPEYPMIKCNVSSLGEKIFHLPFDQQYDRIKIEDWKGEHYVTTVEEAINLGFRRAKKWIST